MNEPYSKGDRWYVQTEDGYEIEFVSYEEAWEYYEEHKGS